MSNLFLEKEKNISEKSLQEGFDNYIKNQSKRKQKKYLQKNKSHNKKNQAKYLYSQHHLSRGSDGSAYGRLHKLRIHSHLRRSAYHLYARRGRKGSADPFRLAL